MEDLFSLLASGATFSKKKNAESMRIFRGSPCDSTESMERGEGEKNALMITSDSAEDEINAFRNRLRIKVHGQDISKPSATFYDMRIDKGISELIFRSCEESEWKKPTPI